jgi:hypothetical protein
LTLDVYAYRGVTLADNYINTPLLTGQRSAVEAVGYAMRGNLASLMLTLRWEYQAHHRPYAGTGPTPATYPDLPESVPGTPNNSPGKGHVGAADLVYGVFPWLFPGVRAEYTLVSSRWGKGSLLRLQPGVSFLLRPSIKVSLLGTLEKAHKLPPAPPGAPSWWTAAGGYISPDANQTTKIELQRVNAFMAWSF